MHQRLRKQIFANNVACNNETTPIFGLEVTTSPTTGGSLMVGFDFGVPCGPITNTPPSVETGPCTARGCAAGRGGAGGGGGAAGGCTVHKRAPPPPPPLPPPTPLPP